MRTKRFSVLICMMAAMFSLTGCTEETETRAKYIFLFIGDGMGNSHVAATESYLSYKAGKLGGEQLCFTQFPYLGLCTTYSADNTITDSAAAGTAIACGDKTDNGMIGVNPEGEHYKSIAYELKEDGYKIGITTSVTINHATPASFYGHNKSRSAYYSISQEIPATGFEFFGGSGFGGFNGNDGNEEDTDIFLERNGYQVCYGVDEFTAEAPGSDRVIFCQESNRKATAATYVSDGKVAEDVPLAKILEMAVSHLGDEEPFFIMCEGGAIDWVAHDNKTMATVHEILDFDEAVKVAYRFYLQHPDETLIVVTADHETGGIALGSRKGSSTVDWAKFEEQWNADGGKNTLSKADNIELNETCSIGWTTWGHSGAPVPTYAIGKGAEKFCGRLDNTEIKGKILGE